MDKSAPFEGTGLHVVQQSIARIQLNFDRFDNQFPSYGDGSSAYHLTANKNWLASFWSGLLWLVAYHTKAPDDIANARSLVSSFVLRLDDKVRLNHDLGFLFLLSSRAHWQICNDESAHALALRGADLLVSRFRPQGGYIQAWGDADDETESRRFIIDSMMNIPLLYWASRETGDTRFSDAATRHAQTSLRFLLRDDGSTYHTFLLDPATAVPIGPKTHQGYADDSVWSRGQAWAIYGFTVAAEWTGEITFRHAAERAAEWYLGAIEPDLIAPWDFRLPPDSAYTADSSADAIAAGGLLRLARLTGEDRYRDAARERITLLIQKAFDTRVEAQGLFLHGTQHMPHDYGINTYTIFGDYFALEAIMNLLDLAPDFWGPQAK